MNLSFGRILHLVVILILGRVTTPLRSCYVEGSKTAAPRVLFVTLEYADPIFSGNGVLSRAIVRSLGKLGHKVTVVSAIPDSALATRAGVGPADTEHSPDVLTVSVPTAKWLRLDRDSPWLEMSTAIRGLKAQVEEFNPTVLMAVDWSGWSALQQLLLSLPSLASRPALYLAFRVFSQSTELLATDDDRLFYTRKECTALQESTGVMALSWFDAARLKTLHSFCVTSDRDETAWESSCPKEDIGNSVDCRADESSKYHSQLANISVLWPPLRSEVSRFGRARLQANLRHPQNTERLWQRRQFITCCVRLSREKNSMLFANLAVEMAPFLQRHNITLRLCGAAADKMYAAEVKARITGSGVTVEIWDKFSSAQKLMEAFQTSLLNIHPSLHDAFGMTVLEAASVATPSLIHDSKAVGVGEVLSAGEVFRYDLSRPINEVANVVETIVSRRLHLFRVGQRAQRRALQFDLMAFQNNLSQILQQFIPS